MKDVGDNDGLKDEEHGTLSITCSVMDNYRVTQSFDVERYAKLSAETHLVVLVSGYQ